MCECLFCLLWIEAHSWMKLELVYLPEGKYWISPRRVYRLAISMPPGIISAVSFGIYKGYLKHFRWTVVQSVPRGTPLANFVFTCMYVILAISDQYATFICFKFVHKMASVDHFGWPKINFYFVTFFLTKFTPAAILDDRKSLLIAFLAISDQYATFF